MCPLHGAHVLYSAGLQLPVLWEHPERWQEQPRTLQFVLWIQWTVNYCCHKGLMSPNKTIRARQNFFLVSLDQQTSTRGPKSAVAVVLLYPQIILTEAYNEEPVSLKSCSFLLFSFTMHDSMNRRDWRHFVHCVTWIHDLPSLGCRIASPQVHPCPHIHPCEIAPSQPKCFPPTTTGRTQPKLTPAFSHPQTPYFPLDLSAQPCP